MDYTLQLEDLKNKSKAEIEKEIKYLSEENAELRVNISLGKKSEEILAKNEIRIRELMECYLGLKEEE